MSAAGRGSPETGAMVRITEVGPRDGLQNERVPVPTGDKVRFVDMLSATGVDEVEVSSFVSARWVPQLGDASEVFAQIARAPGVTYSALVPNERGLDAALAAVAEEVVLALGGLAALERADDAFGNRERAVGDDALHVDADDAAEAFALRAGTERGVEGKETG